MLAFISLVIFFFPLLQSCICIYTSISLLCNTYQKDKNSNRIENYPLSFSFQSFVEFYMVSEQVL
ncbi:unnamed protein product [Linum tenue]|uniref:Secreted protein n=1 Tax=Linum tenue TaxID=586396 RepID=A0AAV0S0N9_9ROSI|nr:unnamed protein product [Linum tenue]